MPKPLKKAAARWGALPGRPQRIPRIADKKVFDRNFDAINWGPSKPPRRGKGTK